MAKSSLIKLGKKFKKAQDRILIEHSAHNIPPIGVSVGFIENLSEKEADNKMKFVGKIVDIIGSVKNPVVVIKLDKKNLEIDAEQLTFYYQKEENKKKSKKKGKYYSKKK